MSGRAPHGPGRRPAVPLGDLLVGVRRLAAQGDLRTPVHGVAFDSRKVQPGSMFVALRGAATDGHRYLEQAALQGAAALLVELPPNQAPRGPAVVQVADTRAALAEVARLFYGDPSRLVRVVGVTGTNGKTTFCHLLEAVLGRAGRPAGIIGTLGVRYAGQQEPTRNTTPESLELQRILRRMVDGGVHDVALEVSSHALAGNRVDGLSFAVRVFTNLSRDHLDLHGTLEAYYLAKRRLFDGFSAGPAWANLDDPWGRRLVSEVPGVLGFSAEDRQDAALRVVRACQTAAGTAATLEGPAGRFELRSPLIGAFNLENLLAVCAAGLSLGVAPDVLAAGLAGCAGAPGRLQPVADPRGELRLIVDYAHSPDALQRVLVELRRLADQQRSRVVTVFGCGGDRDPGKRPQMGAVAAASSDVVVLTDDNPRTEPSAEIIEDIRSGIPAHGPLVLVEPDRSKAIALAVAQARPGDVVLVAGKGHEAYQERDGVRHPFDDVDQARMALVRRGVQ